MHDLRNSRFWKVIGFLTRTDLDVLSESNAFDRLTVLWTAIALILAFILHSVLWSTVAFLLIPQPGLAVLGGVLVATMICTLEAAMAASDWSLAGALRQPGFEPWHAMRVGSRVVVAVILSYATSLAFGLWLNGPELIHRQEVERRAANAPLIEEAKREKARIHGELVAPAERALAQAEAERAALIVTAQQAARDKRSAQSRADQAALDAQREETGLNRLKGKGPLYDDALMREQQARAEAAALFQSELQSRQSLDRLAQKVEAARGDLKRVSGEFTARAGEIDAHLRHDERYEVQYDSLLSRFITLNKLYEDPQAGAAARHLNRITQLTLICLELILLMVKTIFAPASVYIVRLTARTRFEAAAIDRELGRKLAELHHTRPDLHVVAEDDTEPGDESALSEAEDSANRRATR